MVKSNSIGKVIHWYDKIGVAVVKLGKSLKVGDSIKVKHGDSEFEEEITSMQLNHEPIKSGKKGDEVAIKLSRKASVGSEIHPA
jgi:translation elongation factor EF-1alpha